jgi:3-deoxy-D-manno-octulosonate 8-phosphate phosphatase (KDO 8-P phosphatase)
VKTKLQQVKLVLFDVDGVLCSGDITYLDSGQEIKTFDVQDGMGITMAHAGGLMTGILTGRRSKAISRRGRELKITIVAQGEFDKWPAYLQLKKKLKLRDQEICYIGDDILDLPVLNVAGFSVAVANAREEVKAVADYITVNRGGRGAVREVIDLILKRQGKFDVVIKDLTKIDAT